MNNRARIRIAYTTVGVIVLLFVLSLLFGCTPTATTSEAETVKKQDAVYNKAQPIPMFDWSLQRDLWIQFYNSQNEAAVTYSVIISDYGTPLFETQSIGYPIPADTQLTNPQKIADSYQGGYAILPQSEPNGLYTSPNTNATIVMTTDGKGNIAPVYSESKVLAFPFPVEYKDGKYVRKGDSSINLKVKQ